jgi:hypothetical protein
LLSPEKLADIVYVSSVVLTSGVNVALQLMVALGLSTLTLLPL